jgi:phosphoglycolate phosphatase-like HAD superfamily hydrolase
MEITRQLREAQCVFMDCDGVIFDSNRAKLAALEAVLAGFPEDSHRPMREYWGRSGGVSRYVKFDHFAQRILGLLGAEAERVAGAAVAVFAEHSRAGYARLDPLPDALAFARAVGAERLVVSSGTDGAELSGVFVDKGLNGWFPVVLGSPATKPEHVREQLALRGADPARCLFIGDGAADLAVAQQYRMPFVFLAQHSEWDGAAAALAAAAQGSVARVDSWGELLAFVGA